MKQYWSEGELVEFWTLTDVERQFSDQRTPRGRLGLAVLLKFFQFEGRFPSYHKEVPLPAVNYVAGQLDVPALTWFDYPLKGRKQVPRSPRQNELPVKRIDEALL